MCMQLDKNCLSRLADKARTPMAPAHPDDIGRLVWQWLLPHHKSAQNTLRNLSKNLKCGPGLKTPQI